MTSHSSQGQTAQRVLINVDIEKSELLVNNRFAYVSVSRAQQDAQVYTNDRNRLPRALSREISQSTATGAGQCRTPQNVQSTSPKDRKPAEQEQGYALGMGLQ